MSLSRPRELPLQLIHRLPDGGVGLEQFLRFAAGVQDGGMVPAAKILADAAQAFPGKLPAKVLYAGTAPGLVNGALQINVQLPKELIGGAAVPVQLSIGTYTSAPGTTFAVR